MNLKSTKVLKKYVRKGKDYAKQLGSDVKNTALDMLPDSAKEGASKVGSALKSDYKEIKDAVVNSKAAKRLSKAKDDVKARYTKDGKISKGKIATDAAIGAGVVGGAAAGVKALSSDKSESHEDRIKRKLSEGKPLTEAERKYKKLYMD